jgi:hypothetical protein
MIGECLLGFLTKEVMSRDSGCDGVLHFEYTTAGFLQLDLDVEMIQ